MTAAERGAAPARQWPLLAVLAALATLAPFSVDMYTPSLPRMQADLGGQDWLIQASITGGLLGLGAGQLWFGPLSERIGRRPVILVGVTGWILTNLLCAVVPSAWLLVVVRVANGAFGAAGIVAARSVVRDVSATPRLVGMRVALLAMTSAAAPIVAPVIGAGVAAVGGWQADFLVLAGIGAVALVGVLLLVPETLPPSARHASASVLGALRTALQDRELRWLTLALAAQAFGFYAYVSTASFVVEREFGYTAAAFAAVFGTNAVAMLGGNLLFRRLVRRRHPGVLLGVGLAAAGLGGALLATAAAVQGPHWLLWAASTVFAASMGFVLPGSHSWGQLTRPASGASSALTGAAQFLGGVLGSPATGLIGATALTLGAIIAVSSVLALLAWRLAHRARLAA